MTETLEEIEGAFDRLARWVTEHPREFLGGLGGILTVAAVAGGVQWYGARAASKASEAVSAVASGYFQAMGAQPGSFTFAEPANPETARSVREEYAGRLVEAAESHGGTAAAVDAWVLAGNLRSELGEEDEALASFERAVEVSAAGTSLRGLALVRVAGAYETRERYEDAARAWEEASGIAGFPLRRHSLALAASDWARAGDLERAVALADRVESEPASGPMGELPPHLASRLREISAGR